MKHLIINDKLIEQLRAEIMIKLCFVFLSHLTRFPALESPIMVTNGDYRRQEHELRSNFLQHQNFIAFANELAAALISFDVELLNLLECHSTSSSHGRAPSAPARTSGLGLCFIFRHKYLKIKHKAKPSGRNYRLA